MCFVREREIDAEPEPSRKGFIHVLAQVGCQNHDPLVLFHLLEEIADFDVGIPIVGVLDFAALAEKSVCSIEKKNRMARLSLGKNTARFFSVSSMYLLTPAEKSIL